jgi:hypothetical protein
MQWKKDSNTVKCSRCLISALCLPVGPALLSKRIAVCARCGALLLETGIYPDRVPKFTEVEIDAAFDCNKLGRGKSVWVDRRLIVHRCPHCLSGHDGWKKEVRFT